MASSVIHLALWLLVSTTCQQVLSAQQQQQQYHTISVESLLSSTVCSSTPAAPVASASRPQGGSTFEIFHRPCQQGSNHMTASDHFNTIQRRDNDRVRSIHRRLAAATTSIPARLGRPFHSLDYVVTIGVGTPRRDLTVVLDTGSDLTWVQCTTCGDSCYYQEEPLFNPSKSSSYSNVPCSALECDTASHPKPDVCRAGVCRYNLTYLDGSSAGGNLAYETLALSTSPPVGSAITIGCGDEFRDFSDTGIAGRLGLGQGKMSVIWQTQHLYGTSSFSYCLPARGVSTGGHLSFGVDPLSQPNVTFTPLLPQVAPLSSLYMVELTGISVNGVPLPVQSYELYDGAVVDSGTALTRLLPTAYYPLRDEFRRQMAGYTMLPEESVVGGGVGLDTCYNVTGHDVVTVPQVALEFRGGARIDVDASGILYVVGGDGAAVACLAFQPMRRVEGIGAIIGSMQQRAHNVVFDMAAMMVGFGVEWHICYRRIINSTICIQNFSVS